MMHILEAVMDYYAPHPTHRLYASVLLLGPPFSSTVAAAGSLAQLTGLPWVDLDRLTEHQVAIKGTHSLATIDEGQFRREQNHQLKRSLSSPRPQLIASQDVGEWPVLREGGGEALRMIYLIPHLDHLYERFAEMNTQSREQYRPWLRSIAEDADGFKRWMEEHLVQTADLQWRMHVADLAPLTIAQQILQQLMLTGVCSAY